MECRVDPRGATPLLCAKPRGERAGHPAMFLSLGNVNIMQLQKARQTERLTDRRADSRKTDIRSATDRQT